MQIEDEASYFLTQLLLKAQGIRTKIEGRRDQKTKLS